MSKFDFLGYEFDTEEPDTYTPQHLDSATVFFASATLLFWLGHTAEENTTLLTGCACLMLGCAGLELLAATAEVGR